MIRTKEQLVKALGKGERLHGQMGSRPSAPWKYEVDGVTVHGNAFRAAEKAGLLACLKRHWNHSIYRAKHTSKATA
jgi:hypothetical protein